MYNLLVTAITFHVGDDSNFGNYGFAINLITRMTRINDNSNAHICNVQSINYMLLCNI